VWDYPFGITIAFAFMARDAVIMDEITSTGGGHGAKSEESF
jgi:hypothetical protein